MKEIAKNPPAAQEGKDNAKGSAKKKDKGAEKAPVKEKPKRKGPLDVLPHNTDEWAVYDVPDEVMIIQGLDIFGKSSAIFTRETTSVTTCLSCLFS